MEWWREREAAPGQLEVSFVVPLFNTGDALSVLIESFRSLHLPSTWELVLVDDGSSDGTSERAMELAREFPVPITCVELTRNFGEHAAVLEGYRHAKGRLVVNLDDDLQNPLKEALRLLDHLRTTGAEVVYSYYRTKQHSWFRNTGSRFANACATLFLGKPKDLYLSSFRALRRELLERIVTYQGPYPHIDGLILAATNRIERLEVDHAPRTAGRSGYTLRKLARLAMSLVFNFSVAPLRISSILGLLISGMGFLLLCVALGEAWSSESKQPGWASLMGALAVFSGAQLLMLGIIGEYLGRTFLTVSGKPQALVRRVSQQGKREIL